MRNISKKAADKIALRHLRIVTLEPRGLDRLDFHECDVHGLYDAINEAYKLGYSHAENANKPATFGNWPV